MVITYLGSIGLGLTWGWWLGGTPKPPEKWISYLFQVLFTLLFAAEVYLFLNWGEVIAFSVAVLLSYLVHQLWLRSLARV